MTMSSQNYPIIVLFGDSLTEGSFWAENNGFGAGLSHVYARKADVLNRGFSGYNSRWLLPIFRHILKSIKELPNTPVLLFTIFFGANDACLPGFLQHVPLDEYKSNLRIMITELHAASPSTRVLVITPPPVDPVMMEKRDRLAGSRTFKNTEEYAVAAKEVAAEFEGKEVASLDIHSILVEEVRNRTGDREGEFPKMDGVLSDGLHFESEGNAILFRSIMETVKSKWPEISPENLHLSAPLWRDIERSLNSQLERSE